jgi:3-deoxy-7-phosphoheptulonate synthase
MMVIMQQGATDEQIRHVMERLEAAGVKPHPSKGEFVTVIGAIGDDRELVASLALEAEPGVEVRGTDVVVEVAGRKVGNGSFGLIAGPCAVETREQTLAAAHAAKDAGASMLRGGAYKPRTSPYAFQGLGAPGLEILAEAREETGLPIVTELMNLRQLDDVLGVADVVQIGARNVQNFDLLRECGQAGVPVLLKRGMSTTIEEWLLSAEYVAREGNSNVILCERGIRTFEPATRATLDISAVPVTKSLSSLPVIVDPSHAAGKRDYILPMARAAVAAGADGLIVEIHPAPEHALCDGPQALHTETFSDWVADIRRIVEVMGKVIAGDESVPVGA